MLHKTTTPSDYPLPVLYRHEDDILTHTWTKEMHIRWALRDAARCFQVFNEDRQDGGYTHVWITNANSLTGGGPTMDYRNYKELLS